MTSFDSTGHLGATNGTAHSVGVELLDSISKGLIFVIHVGPCRFAQCRQEVAGRPPASSIGPRRVRWSIVQGQAQARVMDWTRSAGCEDRSDGMDEGLHGQETGVIVGNRLVPTSQSSKFPSETRMAEDVRLILHLLIRSHDLSWLPPPSTHSAPPFSVPKRSMTLVPMIRAGLPAVSLVASQRVAKLWAGFQKNTRGFLCLHRGIMNKDF